MFSITQITHMVTSTATKNAPAILTAFGAVGVVGTALLTAKATFEAAERIHEATEELNIEAEKPSEFEHLSQTDKVKLVWPLYVPAATTGAVSIAAIIMSHRVSSRRAAMLAAAYALNENKLQEYQDKIQEKFGDKKAKEVQDEIVHDRVSETFEESQVIFSPNDGLVLVHDQYSGRYFWSSVDNVERAVNAINHEINVSHTCSASLSEFYDHLNLDRVSTSDYFGWNVNERCEVSWSTTTTPDRKTAVHSFGFVNRPVMGFDSFR